MVGDAPRYEVLSVLGSGGFGTVYRARFRGEGGFRKDVALKVLNPDMEDIAEIAARLRDEARMLGLLNHRAIVRVDQLLQLGGRWCVVMEYVEGVDLRRLVRAHPVPPGPALEVVAEVAGALHAAWHRPGASGTALRLLHRDIKPSNIQITAFGEVKVLDFGIARAEFAEREGSTRSLAFGSPEYMAPERLDFSGDSPAGDIYALGSVLFEALTGTPLGRTSADRSKHQARLEPALSRLAEVPEVSPELVALVARCLDWDPARRPTAADLEREALDIRGRLGGKLLRYWTEQSVPPLLELSSEERAPRGVDLLPAGALLTPTSTATNAAPRAPAPSPGLPRWVVPAAALLGALIFVGGGAGVWMLVQARVSPPPAIPAPPAQPPDASAATATEQPASAPAEPADAEPAPTDASAAPRSSAGAATATRRAEKKATIQPAAEQGPAASEAASAPANARVALSGDALTVQLRGAAGTVSLPGEVAPGEYRILATFPGTPTLGAGSLSLAEGESVTLQCSAGFNKCVVKR